MIFDFTKLISFDFISLDLMDLMDLMLFTDVMYFLIAWFDLIGSVGAAAGRAR